MARCRFRRQFLPLGRRAGPAAVLQLWQRRGDAGEPGRVRLRDAGGGAGRSGAERSAAVSHDHPEGIRGAQATATAIYLARQGEDKPAIRARLEELFGYDLGRTLDAIRPRYRFDVSCQGSVPESIIAFLEADDYESTIRNAISLGGDADTMACIAGGIAEAWYGGVPMEIREGTLERLDPRLRAVTERFVERHGGGPG